MNPSLKNLCVASAASLLAVPSLQAAATNTTTWTKAATDTELSNASAWSGAPDGTSLVNWNASSLMSGLTVNANVSWNSMSTSAAGSAVSISGPGAINLGLTPAGSADAILSSNTNKLTISNDVNLTGVYGVTVVVGQRGPDGEDANSNRVQLTGSMSLQNVTAATGAGTGNDFNLWLRGTQTGAAASTIDGTLTVDGQLGKGDTGTWILNGANTIGWTVINGGTVLAGNDQAFGAGTIYLLQSGSNTIALGSKDSTSRTFSNTLDIATTTTRPGGLSDAPYSGTLTLGGTGAIGAAGTGTLTFSGPVLLGTVNRKFNTVVGTTFSGIVSGNGGGIDKSGVNSLTLSGANDYTGTTNINAGTLITAHNSALGSGSVSVGTGAILQVGNGVNNLVTLGSSAALNTVDTNSTLKLGHSTASIIMSTNGLFNIAAGTNIDITGLNLGVGSYTVIDGTAVGSSVGAWDQNTDLVGGNLANFIYTFALGGSNDAVLTITAVPEPGAALLGGLSLLGLLRRRRN